MRKPNKTICGEVSLYKADGTRLTKKRFYSIHYCKILVNKWRVFFGEAKFKTFYYQVSFLNNENDELLDKVIDKVIERKKQQSEPCYNAEVLYL